MTPHTRAAASAVHRTAPCHLVAGQRAGRHVERRQVAEQRYRHQLVTALAHEPRQAPTFGAEHETDRAIRDIQFEERTIPAPSSRAPGPLVAQLEQGAG